MKNTLPSHSMRLSKQTNLNNLISNSQTNSFNQTNQIYNNQTLNHSFNKSNATLWKSKYSQVEKEEEKKVENEYIDNLKKQVYFMEMELKLMNEREKEIEKSGGFSKSK